MNDWRRVSGVLLLGILLAGPMAAAETEGEAIDMFHPPAGGTGVTWKAFHEDPTAETDEVWHIGEDAIVCTGNPLGYLYAARLGIADRCRIEWFVGPHAIHGVGTFDFLHDQLDWPKPAGTE